MRPVYSKAPTAFTRVKTSGTKYSTSVGEWNWKSITPSIKTVSAVNVNVLTYISIMSRVIIVALEASVKSLFYICSELGRKRLLHDPGPRNMYVTS